MSASHLLAQRLDVGEVSFYELNDAIFASNQQSCQGMFQAIACQFQNRIQYSSRFGTPGAIISYALPYLFAIAGTILFVMIVWGGFEVLTAGTDPKSAENGRKRISNAVIGFLILFSAFWIGQIIQIIFGINFGLGA